MTCSHEFIKEYNLFSYSFDQLLMPMYYGFPIFFIPFYFLVFMVLKLIVRRWKARWYQLIIIMVPIYFLYGFLLFGGQFWHVYRYDNRNFNFYEWLGSEHRDLHFSVASFFSSVLFIWLSVYRKLKNEVDQKLKINND